MCNAVDSAGIADADVGVLLASAGPVNWSDIANGLKQFTPVPRQATTAT
jgi:hypothetical protein